MTAASVTLRSSLMLALAATLFLVTKSSAQAPMPKPPKGYTVQVRYRIYAGRNERLRQFDELTQFLESVGFKREPGEDTEAEDPSANHMSGSIAAAQARKLLHDPRVKSILLVPTGYKVPDEGPVKVQLELVSNFRGERQYQLFEQTLIKLAALGFKENVGYDNRGFTRVLGTIPAGDLETLLKDLRGQPAGWLVPSVRIAELPLPLRSVSPLLVTEVLPAAVEQAAAKETPAAEVKGNARKIAPDLAPLISQESETQPRRLEMILTHVPANDDPNWRRDLAAAAPGLVIEGRIGPLLTVLASPKQAPALADLPLVSTVRLPRPALPPVGLTGSPVDNLKALQSSGVVKLHALGNRGRGIRVAIIDGDFRGYRALLKSSKSVRYVDLTAERNTNLKPDGYADDGKQVGYGTQCARAVALAAPEAELTLIRIDPAAPHQLEEAARYIDGENFRSESYAHRNEQLASERQQLSSRREQLLAERKVVMSKFTDTRERGALMKKPEDKLSDEEKELIQEIKRYDAYLKAQADFELDEEAHRLRVERFLKLQRDLRELRSVRVVACTLVWNEGYPLGGDSALNQYFDARPFRAALWFQAAGNTHGQTWSGYFRDDDGNGVMEFVPSETPLHAGRWTRELNFLGWHPHGQAITPDLPAKAKLRLTIQWREVHEPEEFRQPGDRYREPLAKLRLMVLRQRDPQGQKLPGDDMEVVARSDGLPQRLENQPGFAVYEQSVEFAPDAAGRYALRVEGHAPFDTRPGDTPTLPGQRRTGELRPRIFVEVADPVFRQKGRAVFLDFPTEVGALGIPADARQVITVGAADEAGRPRPYSTGGAPVNMELYAKPETFAVDGLTLAEGVTAFGTGLGASFAAGVAAVSLSAGSDRTALLRAARERGQSIWQAP